MAGEKKYTTSGSEYVFPGIAGGQRRDVRKQVNAIKAEADLPEDFRPLHGLRHVFASGLVSSGVEFQIVRRLLTHRGGTVTHRYAHIRDDALREAAELAGQLIEETTEVAGRLIEGPATVEDRDQRAGCFPLRLE